MPRRTRPGFVPLRRAVAHRFPDLEDPAAAISEGRVLVDGRFLTNPDARVRSDASLRMVASKPLRGRAKLLAALDALGLDVAGVVAVDVGAAAGGFTTALLDRGARRVYAVDVGFGQLTGRLRADPRVVNLERTNVADLDPHVVPDQVDVVTMDLSYLPVAEAVPALDRLRLATGAALVALVKPTFELRAPSLVTDPAAVRDAVARAAAGLEPAGWRVAGCTLPAVSGAGGAVEAFVLGHRFHQ